MPLYDESDRLKRAVDELNSLNSILDKISRISETNHIMSTIINETVRLTDSHQGVVNLVDKKSQSEMATIVRSTGSKVSGLPFKLSSQVSGWVIKNQQTVRIDDADDDHRFDEMDSFDGQYKSLICCPMMARGEIIGLVSLARRADQGPFSEEQARLASIIASQSSHLLANAILYERVAQQNELLELSRQQLQNENSRLRAEVVENYTFENIIGSSPPMKRVLEVTSKVAANDSPVLITGPTGTGKELVARAIHFNSARKDKPFVVKNCGVKTESLLEAELFGHVKGAFTGASHDKPGLFREADGGSIFLDEIGDAPLSTQVAILRVLESGEIRPVGAARSEHVDVRILSATNRDLSSMISEDKFRKDLYYRLNTITLELPSLAARRSDIPLLVEHFIKLLQVKLNRPELSVSSEALDSLTSFDWPGNVRQLEHELERAAIIAESELEIGPFDLSNELQSVRESSNLDRNEGELRSAVAALERRLIRDALRDNGGNIQKTSQQLGLTRKGLRDKMTRYGITVDRA